MPLVNQPNKLPTNKMTVAALVGPAATEVWGNITVTHAPALAGEAMSILVGSLSAMGVAYWVRDRANVVTDDSAS